MARTSQRLQKKSERRPARPAPRRRGQAGPVWLTGVHPVREALRARRRVLEQLWIRGGREGPQIEELLRLASELGLAVDRVDEQALEALSEGEGNHQGVALRAGPLPEMSLEELIDFASPRGGPGSRIVALDGVEDPQNVGAVARVAEAAGARGLILTERRAPPLTPAVSRASAGAIEWLRVSRVSNLGRALATLQGADYWLVAADVKASESLFEIPDRILTGNLVVVLGAEGTGIRRSILEQADHLVEIPMRGEIGSLNVSTAGAVILYDLLRRAGDPTGNSLGES